MCYCFSQFLAYDTVFMQKTIFIISELTLSVLHIGESLQGLYTFGLQEVSCGAGEFEEN